MIIPHNRFEQPESEGPQEKKYHQCISDIFDFVRAKSVSQGISMEECLGLLDVVKGSVQLNIALSKQEQCESEDDDHNEYYGI